MVSSHGKIWLYRSQARLVKIYWEFTSKRSNLNEFVSTSWMIHEMEKDHSPYNAYNYIVARELHTSLSYPLSSFNLLFPSISTLTKIVVFTRRTWQQAEKIACHFGIVSLNWKDLANEPWFKDLFLIFWLGACNILMSQLGKDFWIWSKSGDLLFLCIAWLLKSADAQKQNHFTSLRRSLSFRGNGGLHSPERSNW